MNPRELTDQQHSTRSFGSDPGKTVKLDHLVSALLCENAFGNPAAQSGLDRIRHYVAKLDDSPIGDPELFGSASERSLS